MGKKDCARYSRHTVSGPTSLACEAGLLRHCQKIATKDCLGKRQLFVCAVMLRQTLAVFFDDHFKRYTFTFVIFYVTSTGRVSKICMLGTVLRMLSFVDTDASCCPSHAKLKVSPKVMVQEYEYSTPFMTTCGIKSLTPGRIRYFGLPVRRTFRWSPSSLNYWSVMEVLLQTAP